MQTGKPKPEDSFNDNDNKEHIERRNSSLTISSLQLRTVSITYIQVARAQSCANHLKRLSSATCPVPCGMNGQLSY